jgi:hypothetical protein
LKGRIRQADDRETRQYWGNVNLDADQASIESMKRGGE